METPVSRPRYLPVEDPMVIHQLKHGSIVRLKSGSPDMVVSTVVYVGDNPHSVEAVFFSYQAGDIQKAQLPTDILELLME